MFQFLSVISKLDLFRRQMPCCGLAFLIASLFYRLGSFAVECAGFLATWFVLDVIYEGLGRLARATRAPQPNV